MIDTRLRAAAEQERQRLGNAPLRVFTDRRCLPEGVAHCQMLIPFWGNDSLHDGYDRFAQMGKDFFCLTSLEEAEIALLPFDGRFLLPAPHKPPDPKLIAHAAQFVEKARTAGLKTIVVANCDTIAPVPLPDVIVFRNSLNSRTRRANEFTLPAWHEDLVRAHLGGHIQVRERRDVPSVGFCGLAATTKPRRRRRLKMIARKALHPLGIHIEHNDGIYLRRDAMLALDQYSGLKTQFIVRKDYFGGTPGLETWDKTAMTKVRTEYVQNLVDNDYALSARGYGNFSFRFFEAMSVGRIPLLIDTECVLPYSSLVDYREFCVIVPENQIFSTGAAVAEFHAGLSAEGFVDLQRQIRNFWNEWLSPESFYRNLSLNWSRPANLLKA
jgi:Exostosin family